MRWRAGAARAALAATLAGCALPPPPLPARSAAGSVTIYAAGDIALCPRGQYRFSAAAATADLVEAELARTPGAAVLLLGDMVYPRGSAQAFASCYGPTWGRFKERSYPAPGNHEYYEPGAAGYVGYFSFPAYYTLQLGSWRLYSLDSNLRGAAQAAQLAWLKAALAAHPFRCSLAWWHHPLYSSGGHGSMEVMRGAWELLQAAGAEIVLSGHDHDYERFAPQDAHGRRDDARGIRQFVVGTGGAHITPFLWPLEHSEMRDNSRTGVLRLVLDDASYRWEFLEAQYEGFPNGQAPDRGAGVCH